MTTQPAFRVVRRGGLGLIWYPRAVLVSLVLVAICIGIALLGLLSGSTDLPLQVVLDGLQGHGEGVDIVRGMRLPRVMCGLVVGACLGVSGAVFQSLGRNALASPDIIGVASGAALGAVTAIVVFHLGRGGTALGALVGCVLASGLGHVLARGRVRVAQRLVLVGIGIGAFCQGLTTLLLTQIDPDIAIAGQKWLTGTLNTRSWDDLAPAALGLALLPVVVWCARHLNALEMGDDLARQLGVDADATRRRAAAAGVAMCALAVCAVGPVAFVALASPHLARRLCLNATVPVVPAALAGATLLLGADVAGQSLPDGWGMPVGIATGILGGAYLALVLTRRSS
ncbi:MULTISPECIES: FecCD family ABC transporter permease [unclassified Luteococcus]|uniref:FecCD family ABC transporter permease n=1 Tax=unclassified Luteococcus TaxID=2639923 RepID=UPI00313C047F